MIWFLIIARTLVIFGVALWRAWALWRRPSKSSEWMVVWAILLLGISALLEIASKVDVINGGLHTYLFAWLQSMFLMLAILSTALYFIYYWGNPKARRAYAAVVVTTFLASVLGGLYFTWVVPAGTEVFEFDSPGVVGFYFSSKIFFPIGFLVISMLSFRAAKISHGALSRGLKVLSIGSFVLVAAELILTLQLVYLAKDGYMPHSLRVLGRAGMSLGILLFIIGICIPAISQRKAQLALRRKYKKDISAMTALWDDLSKKFPRHELKKRSSSRASILPGRTSLMIRHYRMFIEIRDGLIRLSSSILPEDYAAADAAANAKEIRRLLESSDELEIIVPVHLIVAPDGDSFDEDVKSIVEFSLLYSATEGKA